MIVWLYSVMGRERCCSCFSTSGLSLLFGSVYCSIIGPGWCEFMVSCKPIQAGRSNTRHNIKILFIHSNICCCQIGLAEGKSLGFLFKDDKSIWNYYYYYCCVVVWWWKPVETSEKDRVEILLLFFWVVLKHNLHTERTVSFVPGSLGLVLQWEKLPKRFWSWE